MTEKSFADYTGVEVDMFRVTLLQLMGNVKEYIEERQHKLKYDDNVKACQEQSCDGTVDSDIASDVGSVVTVCKGSETDTLDTTSSSVTLVTHDMDTDFRLVEEQVSCVEVPLTD
jgi:Tfp pilus assembly major pilin PilA